MTDPMKRTQRARPEPPASVPRAISGQADLVTIDTTWGVLQPMEPVPGVRTIGELELAELVASGATLVDTRVPDSRGGLTIPGAINISHEEILLRRSELDPDGTNILFCNGPQCPQTPKALGSLAEAGFPVTALAYYRGGLHDWVSLAMPTASVET
ncbi:MAG: rhodanese-like domain-containing protein [Actinomycetota bacterium]|nr:rhodanese-like domain-containing protein [Actinomycetota bacterium]